MVPHGPVGGRPRRASWLCRGRQELDSGLVVVRVPRLAVAHAGQRGTSRVRGGRDRGYHQSDCYCRKPCARARENLGLPRRSQTRTVVRHAHTALQRSALLRIRVAVAAAHGSIAVRAEPWAARTKPGLAAVNARAVHRVVAAIVFCHAWKLLSRARGEHERPANERKENSA
eukprot:Amastigsp_a842286_375.p2 type:complete len:172 gc:universal Amastigsp_a842286_375:348-863(+)